MKRAIDTYYLLLHEKMKSMKQLSVTKFFKVKEKKKKNHYPLHHQNRQSHTPSSSDQPGLLHLHQFRMQMNQGLDTPLPPPPPPPPPMTESTPQSPFPPKE
jgi:hypothetical protein